MRNGNRDDPELELAEICLDAADHAEACFEQWWRRAEDAPTPQLRAILSRAAALEVAFANTMRRHADDLLYDYD